MLLRGRVSVGGMVCMFLCVVRVVVCFNWNCYVFGFRCSFS